MALIKYLFPPDIIVLGLTKFEAQKLLKELSLLLESNMTTETRKAILRIYKKLNTKQFLLEGKVK